MKVKPVQEQEHDRIWLLFDVCREIEGIFAELYHFYSDLFADNVEASRMWKKTAMEEENHQHQFALARRMLSNIECVANVDIDSVVTVRDKLLKLVPYMKKNPPDLVTALTRAIEMEEKLMDLHASRAVSFSDPEIKKFFAAMINFDQDHVEMLRVQLKKVAAKSQSDGK